jgi:hypothetical protein
MKLLPGETHCFLEEAPKKVVTEPAGHGSHLADPVLEMKKLGGHFIGSVEPTVEKLPIGLSMQEDDPEVLVYFPAAHITQLLA